MSNHIVDHVHGLGKASHDINRIDQGLLSSIYYDYSCPILQPAVACHRTGLPGMQGMQPDSGVHALLGAVASYRFIFCAPASTHIDLAVTRLNAPPVGIAICPASLPAAFLGMFRNNRTEPAQYTSNTQQSSCQRLDECARLTLCGL